MSALSDILNSVLERGARLVDWGTGERDGQTIEDLAAALMSSRGEASGLALAVEMLGRYSALDAAARLGFFRHLAERYDPDPETVGRAAGAYAGDGTSENLKALCRAVEPPRQELFRRLNMAPGGTARLVAMRADLLGVIRDHPDLRRIDDDFRHLLGSWFNPGFLVLRRIDWQTPAAILEKIIAYEAVHEIDSWDELRRRVAPADRRCFAFFHPSMPDEPLIFVEVALTDHVPGAIREVLDPERPGLAPDKAGIAVFYSISNCQAGLAGVSFGAFLIKQVAHDLAAELPGLDTFVTLSPVPRFVRWLRTEAAGDADAAGLLARLDDPGWHEDEASGDLLRPDLLAMAARYLLEARRADGQPPDPVARFHLGNGAELMAIHWPGDLSPRGLAEAAGLMVNYHYRLDRIEANHEAYRAGGTIAASRAVKALLRAQR